MQPVSTWSKAKILVLSIVVALLPLLVLLLLANAQAKREVRQDIAHIAAAVLDKTETTLERANALSLLVVEQIDKSCEQLQPMLARVGILEPAIRSLTLWRPEQGVCSSLRVEIGYEEGLGLVAPLGKLPVGTSLQILESTSMRPGSPVLVYARTLQNGTAVLVTVEGAYLAESLNAFERWNQAVVSVRVQDKSEQIHGGAAQQHPDTALNSVMKLMSRSYPIQVSVGMHEERSNLILIEKIWALLPYALVLSLIVAYLAYRILIFQGSLMAAVGRGIRHGQFYIAYQPIVRLESGQVYGAEALMRWESRQHASLSPELLFAIAEEMELGLALTRHVFELVAKDVLGLSLPRGFMLTVNVSPNHLMGQTLETDLEPLLRVVTEQHLQLVLEITERTRLVNEAKVLATMNRLRQRGVQFALDDFGAAHNTLSYLERYSFDLLKIDKQFVSAIQKERFDHAVLDSIIALAKRLGVTLVAEGVETARQRIYLSQTHVELGQGFYFSHPMSKDAFEQWLEQQNLSETSPP